MDFSSRDFGVLTLWRYLWRQHGDEAPEDDPEGPEAVRPPSYRQLGQRLNIPRERLPGLFALLRQLVPRQAGGGQGAAGSAPLKNH